jgi:predicted oxidoreductase (fatty acid repression mutant protein)
MRMVEAEEIINPNEHQLTHFSYRWNIPADWELNAQLVFGAPVAPAGDKDFMPLEQRFKVFGA